MEKTLPELTALENILLAPRNIREDKNYESRALELLEHLEILDQKDKFPYQMSGGQQQRTAIARAIIMRPKYLFADEPTGNLDSISGMRVMNLLKEINRQNNMTIVLVTHEKEYAEMASREIELLDGRIIQ